jgi:RNA polymerase sigma-70 factor (ECF subfamily)
VTLHDTELLTHAASGDTHAFDVFVVRHAADVHRFVGSLGVHGADADDVLQDTFVAAWRGAGTYRGDGTARAWLFSVARNVVRHRVRRRVGEPEHFAPLDAADSLEAIAEAAGWGSEAESNAYERAELVRTALARLAPADREILVLRDVEGLSGDETAAALSLSLAGMKSRLHRARLRLAALVRALEQSPDPISATRAPDSRTGHDAKGASHA